MKTTQKLFVAIVAIWTIINLNLFAQTSSEPVRDARRIAASFLKLGPEATLNGNFDYSVVVGEGQSVRSSGYLTATVNEDGNVTGITALTVDGYKFQLDKPLTRFPHDSRGKMTGFYLGVDGYTSSGKWVSTGSFRTDALGEADPINIILRPGSVENFVPAELPAGVSADNFRLKTSDGNLYWYDQYRKGFSVWLDPVVANQVSYDLMDASTGVLVQSGGIIQTFINPVKTVDNAFGVTREGGVILFSFTPDKPYAWTSDLKFRTTSDYYGQPLPATVFGVRNINGGNISVQVGNLVKYQAALRVEEVLADGTLGFIKEESVGDDGRAQIVTQGSYNELVLTVFGLKGADENGWWININRQGPQTGNSGGYSSTTGAPIPVPIQPTQ